MGRESDGRSLRETSEADVHGMEKKMELLCHRDKLDCVFTCVGVRVCGCVRACFESVKERTEGKKKKK